MKLLCVTFLSLLLGTSWAANEMGAPVSRDAAMGEASSNGKTMLAALMAGEMSGAEFGEALDEMAENLYLQGLITLEQDNAKHKQIDTCLSIEAQYQLAGGDAKKALNQQRQVSCQGASDFSALPLPSCIQANQVLAGGQCCANTVSGVGISLEDSLKNCGKTNVTCSVHEDCCSKNCVKGEGETSGLCSPVMTCFSVAPLGGACSPENPNCAAGVCRQQNLGLDGVMCKGTGIACSAGGDCCSGQCASGQCQESWVCMECAGEGQKPEKNKNCCRGLIKDVDGICILAMPPFILPTQAQ